MDLLTALSLGFALLTLLFAIFVVRNQREIGRIKKRLRNLNERMESVEKFNGLSATNTDIHVRR